MAVKTEVAVFGAGCFWCTEAVFKMFKGIISVMPGYTGGIKTPDNKPPTYEEICGGKTGYAEVLRIEFDPSVISYKNLLTIFFATHDPTTPNRQGADVGDQYRSTILYTNDEQANEAKEFMQHINVSHHEGKDVVTEIKPLTVFYEAEDYHKNYYEKNPKAPYCQAVINPKLRKVQEMFADLLKTEATR